jgi:hypothetical protein
MVNLVTSLLVILSALLSDKEILVHAMPKLYFRHGTVASAKTLNLLAVAHNYVTQVDYDSCVLKYV